MRGEGTEGMRIILTTIVGLQGHEWQSELGLNISMERTNNGEHFRFRMNWERPNVMGVVIL